MSPADRPSDMVTMGLDYAALGPLPLLCPPIIDATGLAFPLSRSTACCSLPTVGPKSNARCIATGRWGRSSITANPTNRSGSTQCSPCHKLDLPDTFSTLSSSSWLNDEPLGPCAWAVAPVPVPALALAAAPGESAPAIPPPPPIA